MHDWAIATLAAAAAEHREGESARARARGGRGPFVVVPTRDGEGALKRLIHTLTKHTKYKAHASSTAISTVPSIFAVRTGGGDQSDDDRRPPSGSGASPAREAGS